MKTLMTICSVVFLMASCQSPSNTGDETTGTVQDEVLDSTNVTLERDNTATDMEDPVDTMNTDKDFLDENGDTLNTDQYDRGVDSSRLRPAGGAVP